jgi:phosphate transport system substrate-binding protein
MANSARRSKAGSRLTAMAARRIFASGLFFAATFQRGSAQTAESLSQIRRILVEPLGRGTLGNEFRERVIDRLRKDGHFTVVEASQQADAVMSGTAEIWVTGHVSVSPRTSSTTKETVLGGFLSARVMGRNNEVLWSYLVTPRKVEWGGIVHDLADNLTTKLLEARRETIEAASTTLPQYATAVTLHGAGATFPAPLYQKWFQSFQTQQPNHHLSYDGVGSEEGIRQLEEGKIDFAASDMPLPEEGMSRPGTKFEHFATVLGAVVPIYNLAGVAHPLNFTPEVLAEIYLGEITHWNDPKIRASNRGVSLPDRDIVVVHRSDGSGTTFVWSDFLTKVSPEWKSAVGRGDVLHWPVGTGAEHSEGVAVAVRNIPNSIGYVEMIFALQHQLSFGAVRNAAGVFVRADLGSVTAAAASGAAKISLDFRVSITNAPGAGAYPISSFTWLLLPEDRTGIRKVAMDELVRWILTTGQKECSELGYAPLPREVVNRELQALPWNGNGGHRQ